MFILHEGTLLTADWHTLHRNIYWFLPLPRKKLSGAETPKELSPEQFLQAEKGTCEKLFSTLKEVLENQKVHRFCFLGDLVFGLTHKKGARDKLETLRENLPLFFEFFAHLEKKGVKRHFILGNHDDFKLRNALARSFYESLFDETSSHLWLGNSLLTHFPLGFSGAYDLVKGSEKEKYYRISKFFYKLDKRLIEEAGGRELRNFHGHIHDPKYASPVKVENVSYQNVCIDLL